MATGREGLIEAARALHARAGAPRSESGALLPPLLVMTDEARLSDPVRVARQLPTECGIVLRRTGSADRGAAGRRTIAEALAEECRARGVLLLVAGDAELAAAVGAGGLHLPERMVRGFARPDGIGIVTAAAHSLEALDRAAAAGADAALLSPVFQTGSHPDAPALGASEFARLSGLARIPVYALGGITAETVPAIAESGAAGIAVTGAFAS